MEATSFALMVYSCHYSSFVIYLFFYFFDTVFNVCSNKKALWCTALTSDFLFFPTNKDHWKLAIAWKCGSSGALRKEAGTHRHGPSAEAHPIHWSVRALA